MIKLVRRSLTNFVYAWGNSIDGQTGKFYTDEFPTPNPICIPEPIKKVQCGICHVSVLTENGHVFTWGSDFFYQLGTFQKSSILTATEFNNPQIIHTVWESEDAFEKLSFDSSSSEGKVIDLSVGFFNNAIILKDGQVYMWGGGINGNGDECFNATPKSLSFFINAAARKVWSGSHYTIALSKRPFFPKDGESIESKPKPKQIFKNALNPLDDDNFTIWGLLPCNELINLPAKEEKNKDSLYHTLIKFFSYGDVIPQQTEERLLFNNRAIRPVEIKSLRGNGVYSIATLPYSFLVHLEAKGKEELWIYGHMESLKSIPIAPPTFGNYPKTSEYLEEACWTIPFDLLDQTRPLQKIIGANGFFCLLFENSIVTISSLPVSGFYLSFDQKLFLHQINLESKISDITFTQDECWFLDDKQNVFLWKSNELLKKMITEPPKQMFQLEKGISRLSSGPDFVVAS